MKGIFIGENIRFALDLIVAYTSKHNIPGLVFCIDFEKSPSFSNFDEDIKRLFILLTIAALLVFAVMVFLPDSFLSWKDYRQG